MGTQQTNRLGELQLELVKSAGNLPVEDFQRNALEILKSVCSFDSVMWGVGTFTVNARPIYHSMNLHAISKEVLTEYGRIAQNSPATVEVARRSNMDISSFNLQEQARGRCSADYLAYTDRFGFKNVVYAKAPHSLPGAVNFIALWRGLDRKRYSEAEVGKVGSLLRSVLELGEMNHRLCFGRGAGSHDNGELAHAMAASTGILQWQDARFTELLHRQWPDYCSAPFLPKELNERFSGKQGRYIGNRIIISSVRHQEKWFLVACANKRMEVLTEAQLLIVEQVAGGRSNKETAARLDIAEKTVRNQLSDIYERLGISGKARRSEGASGVNREGRNRAALIVWWSRQLK